jgi:hypothetical protein
MTADAQQPALISEDWLRSVGFKWHTISGRDPNPPRDPKHWALWMGNVANYEPGQIWSFHSDEDLGLELTENTSRDKFWFCWLRADTSSRYSRFLHIRHIRKQADVIQLVEALSGVPWKPENHMYGKIFTTEQVGQIRERDKRLDIRIAKDSQWYKHENDDSAARRHIPEERK